MIGEKRLRAPVVGSSAKRRRNCLSNGFNFLFLVILLLLTFASASAVRASPAAKKGAKDQDVLTPLWVKAPEAAGLTPAPVPKPLDPPPAPKDGDAIGARYPPAPVPPPPPPPLMPPPLLQAQASGKPKK